MQSSGFSNRIVLAVVGGLVVALIGVAVATHLGAYHFTDALGGAGSGSTTSPSGGQGSVQVTGTIVSIDIFADTFVLKPDGGANVKVAVTSATQYGGGATALGSFDPGQHVAVSGTKRANGTIQATSVTPA